MTATRCLTMVAAPRAPSKTILLAPSPLTRTFYLTRCRSCIRSILQIVTVLSGGVETRGSMSKERPVTMAISKVLTVALLHAQWRQGSTVSIPANSTSRWILQSWWTPRIANPLCSALGPQVMGHAPSLRSVIRLETVFSLIIQSFAAAGEAIQIQALEGKGRTYCITHL